MWKPDEIIAENRHVRGGSSARSRRVQHTGKERRVRMRSDGDKASDGGAHKEGGAALIQVIGFGLALAAAFFLISQGQLSLASFAVLIPGIAWLSGMTNSFIYQYRSLLDSLRYAPLIILDEPSASLDPVGERQIFALLKTLAQEKIILFTTHRYNTIRQADRIVVLVDGRIAESGTPFPLSGCCAD